MSARIAIAGNITAQEYGDPVYRDMDFPGLGAYGHAGIYYGINSSDTHMVIQMIEYHIINYYTLSSFKAATTYWGAYDSTNSSSRPDTFSERETIITYADELDTQDPDYPTLGLDCINPISGWGTIMQPSEVDEIRCDGVVEYCYEYGTDFPVWGKNGTNYDISKYYSEHNTLYNWQQVWPNPDTGLAPVVQCGRAGGSSTYLTSNASIDYPDRTVTCTYYSDRTVVTMRASDQSGIHRIRYKWGSSGTEHSYRYAQHPTQDYQELTATTYSTSDLYYWVQDGAGNDDGYWHIYTITVNQPPNTPYNEYPNDGATGISRTANLDWSCTDPDGDTIYYTVWLSKGNNTFSSGERIKIDAIGSNADAGTMDYGAHYYWKVQADDHKGGVTTVDHWDFYTESASTVTVTVTDSTASEPGSNTGKYRISRTGSTASNLSVYFSMSGSANNGTDYYTISSPKTIPAGSSYVDVTLTPKDDSVVEGNEAATLTISTNSAYNCGSPYSATVTIQDDDSKPTVTVTATDSTASEPGSNTGKYRISRTGSTASNLSVYFSMSGSANNGTDYYTISSPKTIPAGSSYVDVTLTPKDDSVVEGNEAATLTISTNSAYNCGSPYSATVTIQDDDSKPTVTVTATDSTASEPGSNTGKYRISRTGSTASNLSVYFSMSGSANNGTDYYTISSPKTIPAGSSYVDVTLTPKDDSVVEGNEAATLTISTNSAYNCGSPYSATVTIQDDDSKPTVTVTATDSTASEPGSNTGKYRISRTGSTASNLSVYFSMSGSANNGTDYYTISSPKTIPAGSSYVDVTLTPKDDSVVEGNEAATLTISTNSAYNCGSPYSATVTIQDDDSKPTVTVTATDSTASEPGSNTGKYRISRTGSTASNLSVYFSMSGSANNGTDYYTISSPKTIPAGSSYVDVTLTPKDDSVVEGNEAATLTISTNSAYNCGSPYSATVTIQDDDSSTFEHGHTTLDHDWTSITLDNTYQNPVVLIGPPTYHGTDPGVVRLSNVTDNSFDVRFQEWLYKDGGHTQENIPYLVISSGRQQMADGSIWEGGTFFLDGTGNWESHAFTDTFPSTPALFLTTQTYNGSDPIAVRARNVTNTGFEAALFEEENKMDGHTTEVVGYLAVYSPQLSGTVNINGTDVPYLLQAQSVDHRFVPVLSSDIKLEEEKSKDSEIGHINETVSILALGDKIFTQDISSNGGDTIAIRRLAPEYGTAMEWGTVDGVDHNWIQIPLAKEYMNPVIVAKPVSSRGGDPGVIRIRNVFHNSFELRYNEWAYKDGGHTQERVFYMVVEAGERSVAGLTVEAGRLNTSKLLADGWEPITFSAFFSQTPSVFTSVQTYNGGDPVTTRLSDCTIAGFDLTMDEEEAKNDGHTTETIGWVAIEKGSGNTNDNRSVVVLSDSTNHIPTQINFGQSMARRFPVVVSDMITTDGSDPGFLRYQNLLPSSIDLFIQEEASLDAEMNHTVEEVSLFVGE